MPNKLNHEQVKSKKRMDIGKAMMLYFDSDSKANRNGDATNYEWIK